MGKTKRNKDTNQGIMEAQEKSLTEEAIEELRRLLHSSDPKLKIRAISLILRHTEKLKAGKADDLACIKFVEEILKNNGND